jgi:hypothetical protein
MNTMRCVHVMTAKNLGKMKKTTEEQNYVLERLNIQLHIMESVHENYKNQRQAFYKLIEEANNLGVSKARIARIIGTSDVRIHQIIKERHADRPLTTEEIFKPQFEIPQSPLACS